MPSLLQSGPCARLWCRMQVKRLDLKKAGDDYTRWDAFVNACSEATFFHRAGWKEIIEDTLGHTCYFLYAEHNGEIQGVLPLGHVRSRLFGNALTSMPFCVYGGIAALNQDARRVLDEEAQRLASALKVDHLEMRNLAPCHADWPTKDLYVTFRKEIDPDPEKNMLAIPRKQRAMVRKGIKADLLGEIDDNVERFYEAYATSVYHLGTPVNSINFYKKIKRVFDKECEVLTITKEGRVISSVMSFYFRDEVLPYYGGGTSEAREFAANDFMYWELMRRASERGIRIFDFGRSKKGTGSYSFKEHWGFEPQPLYYEHYLLGIKEMPEINPLNPKYKLFIRAWKAMPYALTKIIGPMVAKNLG